MPNPNTNLAEEEPAYLPTCSPRLALVCCCTRHLAV